MNNGLKLLLILTLPACVMPARGADLNSEGIKAYRAGEYSKAEQLYRQALGEEKDNDKLVAICRNLAVLYEAQGKDASEFNKKADELSKAQTSRVTTNDSSLPGMTRELIPGGSLLNPSFKLQQPLRATSQSPAAPVSSSPAAGGSAQSQSAPGESPTFGVGFTNRSEVIDSSVGANSPFGGFQRDSRQTNGLPPGVGYGTGYGTGYSVQTPNSKFQSSDGSPIILNAPDGRPVIIKAPGQNIYAERQNPGGGTTVIINRTE
ncbi:MAG: hypothetical protein K2W95_29650 [Candidatus Obscuribacterales bacterium]|nr:hypothetical protein [Candidatus Obscuribacterales bacterium]